MNNVTGWAELQNGTVVKAAFKMYDTAWDGWVISILFTLFMMLLMIKTRNPASVFITGTIFIGVHFTELLPRTQGIAILGVTLMLAGILYTIIFKPR